jgi:flagellar hook protein FlgE
VTGFATDSGTTFQYQNGYPAGMLRSISVDEQGVVTATYSNGEMTPVFQVALADFPSYEGLSKMGSNLYAQSMSSGQALPGTAGTGRLGNIAPGSLEMSNVDLAEEFVKMITTQRAFQANSRVITTSDEILQELINIKR